MIRFLRHSTARHKLIRFKLFVEQVNEKRLQIPGLYKRLGMELSLPHYEIEEIISADLQDELEKVNQFDNNVWCLDEAVRIVRGPKNYLEERDYKYCVNLMNALQLNVSQLDNIINRQALEVSYRRSKEPFAADPVKRRVLL